jgi:hypothetical protein
MTPGIGNLLSLKGFKEYKVRRRNWRQNKLKFNLVTGRNNQGKKERIKKNSR